MGREHGWAYTGNGKGVTMGERWQIAILQNDLRRLAARMRHVADSMDRFIIPNVTHSDELRGAAGQVDTWVAGLDEE